MGDRHAARDALHFSVAILEGPESKGDRRGTHEAMHFSVSVLEGPGKVVDIGGRHWRWMGKEEDIGGRLRVNTGSG
eukprot:296969-Pelagomonas_calceolata.AAC.3